MLKWTRYTREQLLVKKAKRLRQSKEVWKPRDYSNDQLPGRGHYTSTGVDADFDETQSRDVGDEDCGDTVGVSTQPDVLSASRLCGNSNFRITPTQSNHSSFDSQSECQDTPDSQSEYSTSSSETDPSSVRNRDVELDLAENFQDPVRNSDLEFDLHKNFQPPVLLSDLKFENSDNGASASTTLNLHRINVIGDDLRKTLQQLSDTSCVGVTGRDETSNSNAFFVGSDVKPKASTSGYSIWEFESNPLTKTAVSLRVAKEAPSISDLPGQSFNKPRRHTTTQHSNGDSEQEFAPETRQNTMASTLPDITSPPSPSQNKDILGPELEWEESDLSPAQVVEKDSFPCVCCFEEQARESQTEEGRREFLSAGLKIYSRQPVLCHAHTRKRQARARTVHKDKRGAYYELGQTLLIPEDYQGWFELVPSDFNRASCFQSIADVAKTMPAKFFTRSNLKGIRIEGEGEQQKFLERKVTAGSVLETRGTFTAKWKTQAETGMFKKKTTEWVTQEVTYLKVLDKDQAELLVPLTHKGKFNAIYARGQLSQNAVYSMKDVLEDLTLPVKVRLLFGKAPVVPCIFTGMLVIREARTDEALVASTVLNKRNVLFEIPLSSPVKMKYLSNDEPLQEMTTYKDAKKLCRKYAHLYSTMIKLSPDLDTDQKVIMHVPTDPSVMREADETLRALDLITDISLTGEPKDHLLDGDSASSGSEASIIPKGGALAELTEYKSRESHTHV